MEMSEAQARKLVQLNTDFYATNAESFSSTRQTAWNGWQELIAVAGLDGETRSSLSVLDIACGNMRFFDFLHEQFPACHLNYYGVDNCLPLAGNSEEAQFRELDIIENLFQDDSSLALDFPLCDLTVSFGFMHHIPTSQMRIHLLQSMCNLTKPGGIFAVSLWRFDRHQKQRQKALLTTQEAKKALGIRELHEGDYLLGWQNTPGQYRYCHSFSEADISMLLSCAPVSSQVIAQYDADGKTGDMNTYLVFKRQF